jgi:hypothetical protein
VGRELRRFAVLIGCLSVGACAASAAATSPPDAPRVSVAFPAEVTSAESAVATGRVSAFTGRGSVQLQARRGGRWRSLADAALRHGRFRIAFTLDGTEAVSVRACLDGYNRGTTASPTAPYRSFDYLFGPNYREITGTVAPSKPLLLGEVATSEHGGSKPQWIEEMFAALPTAYPQVRRLLWFDYFDQGNDWPIETSAAAIGDPRYLPNAFMATASGPVSLP